MSSRAKLRAFADRMRSRLSRGLALPPVVHPTTLKRYPVTYAYGVKNTRYAAGYHTGEDHACPVGSSALAVSYGTVVFAGPTGSPWGSAYGTQVIIRTGNGRFDYAHCHLSKALVSKGDQVTPGQVVGLTGATGNVTGPHDHFEARPAGGRYGNTVHPIRVKRLHPHLRRKK